LQALSRRRRDRFDRKRFLLFFYCGFIAETALCALAPNYSMLLLARIGTGLFGGVILDDICPGID
jgi:predicted MFS family arabinose efflux permease